MDTRNNPEVWVVEPPAPAAAQDEAEGAERAQRIRGSSSLSDGSLPGATRAGQQKGLREGPGAGECCIWLPDLFSIMFLGMWSDGKGRSLSQH